MDTNAQLWYIVREYITNSEVCILEISLLSFILPSLSLCSNLNFIFGICFLFLHKLVVLLYIWFVVTDSWCPKFLTCLLFSYCNFLSRAHSVNIQFDPTINKSTENKKLDDDYYDFFTLLNWYQIFRKAVNLGMEM